MIEVARNRINSRSSAVLYSATGIGAAILVSGVIIVAAAKPATATPTYAAQTKLACRRCDILGEAHLTSLGACLAGGTTAAAANERPPTATLISARPVIFMRFLP